MTAELNDKELEVVVGGARFKNDGHLYHIVCSKDGKVTTDSNMPSTQGKDYIVKTAESNGAKCTVTQVK